MSGGTGRLAVTGRRTGVNLRAGERGRMRGCCCWVLLFFVSSAVGLPLMARRRFRRYFALADRIGARDGRVVRELTKKFMVIGFEPGVTVQTLRPGTEGEVLVKLRRAALEAGCGFVPRDGFRLQSEAFEASLTIHVHGPGGHNREHVPEGYVMTEVSIDEWKGFRSVKLRRARGGDRPA
ncbi:hypothetical protein [Amycolatopsis sp. CA-126428]|uniref:hypothetical protein n=1 Tax=Amycolatopsis sp. CA-126428 TaxID=2073158 RepID=UPI000CD1FF47|nr:hypothetical protein [Amycolatopsis sp. CA-126428]